MKLSCTFFHIFIDITIVELEQYNCKSFSTMAFENVFFVF